MQKSHFNQTTLLYAFILVLAVFFLAPRAQRLAHEWIALHVSSSPSILYEIGSAYLSADTHAYDLQRAELFFRRALERDPSLPHARHQLARIAFLQGDFPLALKLINQEISLQGDSASLSSYYVQGLILGYMDRFEESAASYKVFLSTDPTNWAAQNDYAWVLIKLHRYGTALEALDFALTYWPKNAWLHSNRSIALFELGRIPEARDAADEAMRLSQEVTEDEWLQAYPGNDPNIAHEGVAALQAATRENLQAISSTLELQINSR